MNIRDALIRAKSTNALGISRESPSAWYIGTSLRVYYHLIYTAENGELEEDVHNWVFNYNDLTATDWHVINFRKGNKFYE